MPRKPTNSLAELSERDQAVMAKLRPYLVDMLAAGHNINQIARLGSKQDRSLARKLERKLSLMIQHDPATKMAILERTQEILVAALPKAAVALSERVESGRPDAIKLLFELSGAYVKREQHEHSGSVELKMEGVPRPKRIEADDVVEGEIVE